MNTGKQLCLALLIALSTLNSRGQEQSASAYEFKGGYPTPEAGRKARDDADLSRAVQAYRFWYPTVSIEATFQSQRKLGIQDNESLMLLSAAPRHVVFTANSDTPYGAGTLDLKNGPYVVELPPGSFIALANDHNQGWIMDMGIPGPDAGKGGKHLILPPDFKGQPPSGYHTARSSTFKVLVAIRSIPANGDVKGAADALRAIKVYPLSSPNNTVKLVDVTDKKFDATPLQVEDALTYWEMLQEAIDSEPVAPKFAPMLGLLASLGIEKGKPFAPDTRMIGILERAAKIGRDQLLVSCFDSSRPDRMTWKDRRWEWVGLISDNGTFETPMGIDLEARDRWFGQAVITSPAMFRRSAGAGSLYWLGLRDRSGAFLEGSQTYKLSVPQPVPAKLFWSVTVYDAATRSQIQTDQDKAALRSLFELKGTTGGNTLDLYFGPSAPAGQSGRWIKTIPGKGWFVYFRIYGPEQPAFDGSWRPGDFELTQERLRPTGPPLPPTPERQIPRQ